MCTMPGLGQPPQSIAPGRNPAEGACDDRNPAHATKPSPIIALLGGEYLTGLAVSARTGNATTSVTLTAKVASFNAN
jgi:hypothetical protein